MFNWIKKLFKFNEDYYPIVLTDPIHTGIIHVETRNIEAVTEAMPTETTEDIVKTEEKPKKKKASTKKADAVDFDSMSKTQLLAEAKNRGVKANASLKREEILERLKNAN